MLMIYQCLDLMNVTFLGYVVILIYAVFMSVEFHGNHKIVTKLGESGYVEFWEVLPGLKQWCLSIRIVKLQK